MNSNATRLLEQIYMVKGFKPWYITYLNQIHAIEVEIKSEFDLIRYDLVPPCLLICISPRIDPSSNAAISTCSVERLLR